MSVSNELSDSVHAMRVVHDLGQHAVGAAMPPRSETWATRTLSLLRTPAISVVGTSTTPASQKPAHGEASLHPFAPLARFSRSRLPGIGHRVRLDRVITDPGTRTRLTNRVIRWLCRSADRHFSSHDALLRLRRHLALVDRARGLLSLGRTERFGWRRGAINGIRVRVVQSSARPKNTPPASVLLYLHGGAFLLRTLNGHMNLAAGIARAAGLDQAILPIYRLAPEYPYPAAIDDCLAAYRGLLASGLRAEQVVLGGDSAGGGLVLKLLMRLRDTGLPMPCCGVLLSPFTDMSCSGRSIRTNVLKDPMFGRLPAMHVRFYLGETDPRDPNCSPLFGDFAGLPPLIAQVGSTERLLDDTVRLAPRVRRAGGVLEVEVWNEMPHVWQAMGLPESAQAIESLGRFIRRQRARAALGVGEALPIAA